MVIKLCGELIVKIFKVTLWHCEIHFGITSYARDQPSLDAEQKSAKTAILFFTKKSAKAFISHMANSSHLNVFNFKKPFRKNYRFKKWCGQIYIIVHSENTEYYIFYFHLAGSSETIHGFSVTT